MKLKNKNCDSIIVKLNEMKNDKFFVYNKEIYDLVELHFKNSKYQECWIGFSMSDFSGIALEWEFDEYFFSIDFDDYDDRYKINVYTDINGIDKDIEDITIDEALKLLDDFHERYINEMKEG